MALKDMRELKSSIYTPTLSATAEVQDVLILNAANAGAVCRPALTSHMGW